MKRFLFLFLASAMLLACKQSASTKQALGVLEEKVFVVNIVPDSVKLAEYLSYHQKIWPEVEAGFKKAGYKKIVLHRFNNLLVMTIAVPEGSDLDAMGKLAESYSPRCAEWNKLMDSYQQGVPGTAPGQKWVEAKPFYSFKNP